MTESGGKAALDALRAELLEHSLSLPEAYLDHPWGENVAKVNKKIFVFLGHPESDSGYLMSVMLPGSFAAVLMHDFAEPTGYGLGKSGWVSLRHNVSELPPAEVLQDWIEESYCAIAPKRLVRVLEARR